MTVKDKVRPFLLFQGQAEEAMNFYVSLFPGSQIGPVVRYGPGDAGAEGSVKSASFDLNGLSVLCTDSVVKHEFGFTPAISFFVVCDSAEEIERLAGALSERGSTFMPLGSYGFSRQFAWVSDRYGVSWQLTLE
jgi:predicted 3-demethylubiquinone-9 3-methyltransferase (glyoxalase superfamily)